MAILRNSWKVFAAIMLVLFWIVSFPSPSPGQGYPNKPITVFCGYAAGASTDVATRCLAEEAEKLLGVPVLVESKAGGSSTVCAGLVASKKPDGYTLGVLSGAALNLLPHLMKLSYKPLKDFTLIMQFARFPGGLCVHHESPIRTIDEFLAYARANPGLSYGSPGMYSQQSMAVELLAQCKGLKFKHVPFKGGSEASTALLGKHLDFAAGSGAQFPYAKKGVFRFLVIYNTNKRDPNFPDVPTLREIGCEDYPANGLILVGPRGLPPPVVDKLRETFKMVSGGPAFQKVLANFDLAFDYQDQPQLEKEIPLQHEWIGNFLLKFGVRKDQG